MYLSCFHTAFTHLLINRKNFVPADTTVYFSADLRKRKKFAYDVKHVSQTRDHCSRKMSSVSVKILITSIFPHHFTSKANEIYIIIYYFLCSCKGNIVTYRKI